MIFISSERAYAANYLINSNLGRISHLFQNTVYGQFYTEFPTPFHLIHNLKMFPLH